MQLFQVGTKWLPGTTWLRFKTGGLLHFVAISSLAVFTTKPVVNKYFMVMSKNFARPGPTKPGYN